MEDKIKTLEVLKFAEFRGKEIQELLDHLNENYKDRLATEDISKFFEENPDKIPEQFKDGNFYFFFGSAFRRSDGEWDVPCGRWNDGEWRRYGLWARNDWSSDSRVVLFGNTDTLNLNIDHLILNIGDRKFKINCEEL